MGVELGILGKPETPMEDGGGAALPPELEESLQTIPTLSPLYSERTQIALSRGRASEGDISKGIEMRELGNRMLGNSGDSTFGWGEIPRVMHSTTEECPPLVDVQSGMGVDMLRSRKNMTSAPNKDALPMQDAIEIFSRVKRLERRGCLLAASRWRRRYLPSNRIRR